MQAKLLNGDTLCALLDENAEGLVENGLQTQVLWLALGFGLGGGGCAAAVCPCAEDAREAEKRLPAQQGGQDAGIMNCREVERLYARLPYLNV